MVTMVNSNYYTQVISTNGIVRSRNLLAKLADQKIPYQFTEGVVPALSEFDSGNLHSRYLSRLICQRELKLGEVGCALAHINAARNFLKSNAEYGIVFEDDAEILQKFDLTILDKSLNSIKPSILILGWIPGYAIAEDSENWFEGDFFKLVTPTTCTFGYALNKPAAELIVNGNRKVLDVADWPTNLFNRCRFLIVNTPWVDASDDPSDSMIGLRANISSAKRWHVFTRKLKLFYSIATLLLLSKILRLNISTKQVIHRILLRDFLYKFGRKEFTRAVSLNGSKNIVFLPKKYSWLIKYLNHP
jgi:hypothetical protein